MSMPDTDPQKPTPRKRAPRKPSTRQADTNSVDTIPAERVEILPPQRAPALDWRKLAPTIALGTATGFVASLIVGGGGILRHAVVGVLGLLVGQGLVRLTGWRVQTGHRFLDEAAMAVIGAILVVLLARFIA